MLAPLTVFDFELKRKLFCFILVWLNSLIFYKFYVIFYLTAFFFLVCCKTYFILCVERDRDRQTDRQTETDKERQRQTDRDRGRRRSSLNLTRERSDNTGFFRTQLSIAKFLETYRENIMHMYKHLVGATRERLQVLQLQLIFNVAGKSKPAFKIRIG